MKLDELVADALEKLENMSVEEFESECHRAGYVPVRKSDVPLRAAMFVNSESVLGTITYRHNVVLNGQDHQSFRSDSSEESFFPVAA